MALGPDVGGGGGGVGPGPWFAHFLRMRSAAHVTRGPGPAAVVALRRAGYTVKLTRGKVHYSEPGGKRLGKHAARNIGRVLLGKKPVGGGGKFARATVAAWRLLNPFPTATAAPPPTKWPYRPSPGASDQVPDTSGRYSPWPPQPQAPSPPPRGPSLPDAYPVPVALPGLYSNIWAMVIAYAAAYALPYLVKKVTETWDEYFGRWQAQKEANERALHRRKPGGPGSAAPRTQPPRHPAPTAPGRGDPFPSTPAPQVTVNVTVTAPPQVSAPSPAVVPAQTPSAAPTTAPATTPTPVSPKKPLWQLLLEQYGSAQFQQKGKRPIKVVNFTDPLTASYARGVDSFAQPYGDYAAWSPDATGTDACTCPKKKGKKRKKRTVCYRGTYTETASGLTKRKREKVPCK